MAHHIDSPCPYGSGRLQIKKGSDIKYAMTYGWNKFRKEGIEELRRIAGSKIFGNKDIQRKFIESYINTYKLKEESNLSWKIFYPDEKEKDEEALKKSASSIIGDIRENLDKYYKSEEGKTKFEIYFIAEKGNYRLGVRPKPLTEEQQQPRRLEDISYAEFPYYNIKYRPISNRIVSLFLLFLSPALFILGLTFLLSKKLPAVYFPMGLVSLLLSVLLFPIGQSLLYLSEKKFKFLIAKYFLRLSESNVIIASYSGNCPICHGNVELKHSFLNRSGYEGKCQNNPDNHIFSFDYMSLSGKRVSS